jgi:hypothetical protein
MRIQLSGESRPNHQGEYLPASAVKPALRNLRQLINALKTRGKKVRRKGRVEQPFLSVKGQIITIDGEDVQVFEYRTAHAATLTRRT